MLREKAQQHTRITGKQIKKHAKCSDVKGNNVFWNYLIMFQNKSFTWFWFIHIHFCLHSEIGGEKYCLNTIILLCHNIKRDEDCMKKIGYSDTSQDIAQQQH